MFTYVGKSEKGRRRATLVIGISLALHLAALSALLAAQLWSVPPVQEPPVNTVFLLLRPLPGPPGGGGQPAIKQEPVAKQTPAQKPALRQPDLEKVPATPPPEEPRRSMPETIPDPNASTLQTNGPAIPGDGPGPGPVGTGPDDGPAAPANPVEDILYVNGSVVRPQLIPETKVQPRYNEPARTAHLQGMVLLEAIIDERGNVVNVRVQRGLPLGLTEEAIAAVSQWKFRPATLGGRPVKVYFNLRVDFLIH